MQQASWLTAGFIAATAGCQGSDALPDAERVSYSQAVQNLAEQQRELRRLRAALDEQLAKGKQSSDEQKANDRGPAGFRLDAAPHEATKLDEIRLDLGPAQQEARRNADAAQAKLIEQLEAQLAKQQERVKEAQAIKEAIDN